MMAAVPAFSLAQTLPLEIVGHIASFAEPRSLFKASLVCRGWRHAFQPQSLVCVELEASRCAGKLLASLLIDRFPIKFLNLACPEYEFREENIVEDIIRRDRSIEQLCIHCISRRVKVDEAILQNLQDLDSLYLRRAYQLSSTRSASAESGLLVLPNVRALCIYDIGDNPKFASIFCRLALPALDYLLVRSDRLYERRHVRRAIVDLLEVYGGPHLKMLQCELVNPERSDVAVLNKLAPQLPLLCPSLGLLKVSLACYVHEFGEDYAGMFKVMISISRSLPIDGLEITLKTDYKLELSLCHAKLARLVECGKFPRLRWLSVRVLPNKEDMCEAEEQGWIQANKAHSRRLAQKRELLEMACYYTPIFLEIDHGNVFD